MKIETSIKSTSIKEEQILELQSYFIEGGDISDTFFYEDRTTISFDIIWEAFERFPMEKGKKDFEGGLHLDIPPGIAPVIIEPILEDIREQTSSYFRDASSYFYLPPTDDEIARRIEINPKKER